MPEETGRLTIVAERGGTIAEISEFLSDLENAYLALYTFDQLWLPRRLWRRFMLVLLLGILTHVPSTALAQERNLEALAARIEQLERTIADLERRIVLLESQAQPAVRQQQPPISGGHWREITNWRRLQRGMTMDQVTELLGQPEKVDAGVMLIFWYWGYPGGGHVFFDADTRRVDGWSEPSR